jgi:hypothetical protein
LSWPLGYQGRGRRKSRSPNARALKPASAAWQGQL